MPTDSLTDAQWQQLLDAGPQIARAVAAAAGSAERTEAELESFIGLVDRTAHEERTGTLLGDLAARLHAALSAGAVRPAGEDVIFEGIHAARQAGAILAVMPDEGEARAVRLWLMRVANSVASAAREGGVLGIGAEEVSGPERDTIASIADALGLTTQADS